MNDPADMQDSAELDRLRRHERELQWEERRAQRGGPLDRRQAYYMREELRMLREKIARLERPDG